MAGTKTVKAKLAADLRTLYGVQSVLSGARNARLNVATYRHKNVPGPVSPATWSDSGSCG